MYEKVQCKYNKFWVPLVWANTVLTEARREGKIESDIGFRLLLEVRGFSFFFSEPISAFSLYAVLCIVQEYPNVNIPKEIGI